LNFRGSFSVELRQPRFSIESDLLFGMQAVEIRLALECDQRSLRLFHDLFGTGTLLLDVVFGRQRIALVQCRIQLDCPLRDKIRHLSSLLRVGKTNRQHEQIRPRTTLDPEVTL
jgi:hypothetical protein